MTIQEYDAYTSDREAETIRKLSATMLEAEARAGTARGTAHFLPEGLDTKGHYLVIAEDADGCPVGHAWIGPNPHHSDVTDQAWLYDINVRPEVRRMGYGSSMLRRIEALVVGKGARMLGLDVDSANTAAVALYQHNGYEALDQQMTKSLIAP